MPNSVFQSESEWLAQMTAMRQANADLKLPALQADSQMYGADVIFDEDSSDSLEDDIWDVDGELDESSLSDGMDHGVNGLETIAPPTESAHDRPWLRSKCSNFANSRSGMDAADLEAQIIALLASDTSDDELQMTLAEIIGFDDLDFVIDLISHRKAILHDPTASTRQTDGLFGDLQTRQERDATLRQQDYEHKHAPIATAYDRTGPKYPHVYKSEGAATGNRLDLAGKKYALPLGSTREDHPRYEEYSIPATKVGSVAAGQKLVAISDMDGLCQKTFRGYKSLNRMQSLLYPVAYTTSENMLICAPTGAGKTDAAMLTILNAISKNVLPNPIDEPDATDFVVMADDFKVVYVAPMKALAAEVTDKLGKRLAWLGVQVRELTGDMQLTKREIAATQIIVTTPEKWDVVTRKSTGDTELVQKVRLLIIDEVHMLHDERGAVIESLVARTQRQSRKHAVSHSYCRVVCHPAKLHRCFRFFESQSRSRTILLRCLFQTCATRAALHRCQGKGQHQDVQRESRSCHIRKGQGASPTRQTGHGVRALSKRYGQRSESTVPNGYRRRSRRLVRPGPGRWAHINVRCQTSRPPKGRELRDIVPKGFGCHHAGMPRTDRNFVERIFGDGAIRVLCCTGHARLGCQSSCCCCHYQRDPAIQFRSWQVCRSWYSGCVTNLWACWSPAIPGFGYWLHLHSS